MILVSNKEINTLVGNVIQKDITPLPSPKDNFSLKKSPSLSTILSYNNPKIDSFAKVSISNEVMNTSLPTAPCHSRHKRKLPSCFALIAVDEVTTLGNVNLAFIAVSKEPKTYQETIHSPHLKQWKQTIKLKFA